MDVEDSGRIAIVFHIPLQKGKTAMFTPTDAAKSTFVINHLEKIANMESGDESNSVNHSSNNKKEDRRPMTLNDIGDEDEEEDEDYEESFDEDEDEDLEEFDSDKETDVNPFSPNIRKPSENIECEDIDYEYLFSNKLDTPEVEVRFKKAIEKGSDLGELSLNRKTSSQSNGLLKSHNSNVVKLGTIIRNIEMREQHLKSTLVRGDKRTGDSELDHSFTSDLSFVSDGGSTI